MKLKTSFFNSTVLGKDITRFAPIWGLYLVAMLLITLGGFSQVDASPLACTLGTSIGIFAVINLIYALLVGELLFGDLFNARLCNALHAMPMRREGWFLTHLVSGLSFSVVPNLVVALCLIPMLREYWFVAFVWLAGMTLSYLFFFGAAVLSALCTGNRFAMALVYGMINFLSVLMLWIAVFLYEPMLYGITINSDPFLFLCPVWTMAGKEHNFTYFLDMQMCAGTNCFAESGWPYLIGNGLMGIVMMFAALLVYRRRKLESAGDFMAVRPLQPIFSILYTLIAGILTYLFSELFNLWGSDYLFLAAGIAVGHFTGQMLLRRTVKVFNLRTFIGLAAVAAVLFSSLWVTSLDPFGMVRWTPQVQEVASVMLCGYDEQEGSYTAADPEEIAELIACHGQLIADQDKTRTNFTTVQLRYTLKSGRRVERSYYVERQSETCQTLRKYFSRPECVLGYEDYDQFLGRVVYAEVGEASFYDEDARALTAAIKADCDAGTMVQNWSFRSEEIAAVEWVYISLADDGTNGDNNRSVCIGSDCINTLAWLEDHGMLFYDSYDNSLRD